MICQAIIYEGVEYYDSVEMGQVYEFSVFETLESGLRFASANASKIPHIIVRKDPVTLQLRRIPEGENATSPLVEGTQLLILKSWIDVCMAATKLELIRDANGSVVPVDVRFHHRNQDMFIISAHDLCEGFSNPHFDSASLKANGYEPNVHYIYIHSNPNYTLTSLYLTEKGLAKFAHLFSHPSITLWMTKMRAAGILSMQTPPLTM